MKIIETVISIALSGLVFLTFTPSADAQNSEPRNEAIPLLKGTIYTDSLVVGDIHTYTINFENDQFVFGTVAQQSVDITVTVTAPGGRELSTFNWPRYGPELFQFTTDTSGTYRIKIAPSAEASGRYKLSLKWVEAVAADRKGRLDQIMAAYDRPGSPGAVMAIVKNGEIIFARGYGLANVAHSIPFTLETPSNIGSISKQFTAFAIALLADQGKISLNDPVRKYVPEVPVFEDTIRIRHLIHHQSGLRGIHSMLRLRGWQYQDVLTKEDVFRIIARQPELQFTPGSKILYNNVNYILLAEIVEQVADTSFSDWMEMNVFKPLGMAHTTIKTMPGQIIPGSALGYVHSENGLRRADDIGAGIYGPNGIYTTAGDLAMWLDNFRTARVGGPDVIEQMQERGVLANGDTTAYAFGIEITKYRGLDRIRMGGRDFGHNAMFIYYPDPDAGMILMSNFDYPPLLFSLVSGKINEVFFGEYLKPEDAEATGRPAAKINPELLKRYTGKYKIENGPPVEFILEQSQFFLEFNKSRFELSAMSDTLFRFEMFGAQSQVIFHPVAEGPVESVTVKPGGRGVFRANRIEVWKPGGETLKSFTGRYYSPELETFYTLFLQDGKLVARHFRNDPVTLSPVEKDMFRGSESFFETTAFKRGEDKQLTGFYVSNGRVTNVWFERQ